MEYKTKNYNVFKLIANSLFIASFIVLYAREGNLEKFNLCVSWFAGNLSLLFKEDIVNKINFKLFIKKMNDFLDCQNLGDYCNAADILETSFIPVFIQLLNEIREDDPDFQQMFFMEAYEENLRLLKEKKEIELLDILETSVINGKYKMDLSLMCYATLYEIKNNEKYYLMSSLDPYMDAIKFVKRYVQDGDTHYCMYGLGLGYEAIALSRALGGVRVDVYEPEKEIIHYVLQHHSYKMLMDLNIHIHYDFDLSQFRNAVENHKNGLIINFSSAQRISDLKIRNMMLNLYFNDDSYRRMMPIFKVNMNTNLELTNHFVDELKEKFLDKTVYLIAAGPSLDITLEKIQKVDDNVLIVCVGTVYKKLIRMGIIPDYVVIFDGKNSIWSQFENISAKVPVIMAITACRKVAESYDGNKYLMCHDGYPEAEKYGLTHNKMVFKTGGSVSTIALDMAVQLGASKIICLGLDLSYPNDKSHATDSANELIPGNNELIQVENFDRNGFVYTNAKLDGFRRWIVNYLRSIGERNPVIINASEQGAYIEGMIHKKLE